MELIFLGTILNYRGVKGDFLIVNSNGTNLDIGSVKELNIGFSSAFSRKFSVEKFESFSKGFLIKLKGIESKEEVIKYVEQGVYIDESLVQNDPSKLNLQKGGIFLVYDNSDNKLIGEVIEIWEMPANDVLYVKTPGGNLPIPIIDEVIVSIDNEANKIIVNMIDGLWNLLESNNNES